MAVYNFVGAEVEIYFLSLLGILPGRVFRIGCVFLLRDPRQMGGGWFYYVSSISLFAVVFGAAL